MSIAIDKKGVEATIIPDFNVTSDHVDELHSELVKLVGSFALVTVDFANVNIIDSAGIGMLIATRNAMFKLHHHFLLSNVNHNISEMFMRMHLDRHFEMV